METSKILSMKPLTIAEIKEAFPDELPLIKRNLKIVNKLIAEERERNKAFLNKTYQAGCYWFGLLYVEMFKTDKFLQKVQKRLQLLRISYENKEEDLSLKVERAKQVRIQDLFPIQRGRESSRIISCCCPIHNERTPSFVIYKDTNSFYCFGCHIGGDVIKFYMLYHNCEFIDAVKGLGG